MALMADNNKERQALLISIGLELSQDSDSSSSEEDLQVMERLEPMLASINRRRRRKVPRLQNYVEEVIPRWTNSDFKSHFRISRETCEYLITIIGNKLKRHFPGLVMLSPTKQILITIWRMATPDSYRSICEKFGVSRSTALLTVRRVTKALVSLARAIIRWPTRYIAQQCWTGFEVISGFPKVLGAIDGTHIHIPAPKANPEAYVNRKGYHSIQLQAICDHKARFLHCLVGHVGSVHDQRVFRLSEVQDFLGNEEKFPEDCHLVGDPAYKLHPNLLIPYTDNGHLTERQQNFNFCQSSARMAIERAFGLLKGRFRSLMHCLPMTDTASVPDFVLACCVLHNICILQGDELEISVNLELDQNHVNAVGQFVAEAALRAVAIAKRDLICDRLPVRHV